ncbi:MAG TPA: CARDB domain-containing protein, partial [Baekduia sp.]|nr:CARDB domain-containing protein [Baekduia sp.]
MPALLDAFRPATVARLAVVAVVLAAVPAAGASATALPDLRLTTKAPAATVAPGKKLSVTVTLRNAGRAKAGATTTRISIGSGSTFTKGDRVLATIRQKAVAKGARTSAKVTVTVPRSAVAAAAGRVKRRTILACADSGRRVRESAEGDNCTRVARVDARATGTVDGQSASQAAAPAPAKPVITAPTYTPPPKWDNDDAKRCADKRGAQVPQDADLLQWDSKVVTAADSRFWWPKSRPDLATEANALAKQLSDVIYPKLTKLMGHVPMSDSEMQCAHGPDGKLDIYLVDIIDRPYDQPGPDGTGGSMGTTAPYSCRKGFGNPSYVYLARRDKETLAHEFFHVLQNTYGFRDDCKLPPWLDEGTAEWAVEYVYPHSLMDETASAWLQSFQPSLLTRDYDAWTFWYAVQKHAGAAAIAGVFPLLADRAPVDAADAAIAGGDQTGNGFRARWAEFARDAYNRDIVDDTFKTPGWTLTSYHVTDPSTMQILLSSEATRTVPIAGSQSLDTLARKYDIHTFNDRVRMITVEGLPTSADYKLHALLTLANGTKKEVDVSDGASWCRDKPEQDIAEIVLISSNASPTTPVTSWAKLRLDATCTLPHYKVLSASFDNHVEGTMSGSSVYCGTVHGTEDYGGSLAAPKADPDFKLTRSSGGDLDAYIYFDVTTSGVKTNDGCTDEGGKQVECHMTMPWNIYSDQSRMGVHLGVDAANPSHARLEWMVHEASIGVIDYGDDNCNIFEFRNQVPLEQRSVDIALDDIKRGKHTYTISKSTTWNT